MQISSVVRALLPGCVRKWMSTQLLGRLSPRRESNKWLRHHCRSIKGSVLSIGSHNDADGEGLHYRDYFTAASSYITSEVVDGFECDRTLDVRSMLELRDDSYDCVFCSGVLEHVDDHMAGLNEITRILKPGGILLLGLPFRQSIHMGVQDFWRFTEHGIRYLLRDSWEILDLISIGERKDMDFPFAYWVKAEKSAGKTRE